MILNSILSSGASKMNQATLNLSGTLGQSIIQITSNATIKNSQGFWVCYQQRIISELKEMNNNYIMNLYPNPVSNNAILELNLESQQELFIEVIDIMGRKALSLGVVKLIEGLNAISLELEKLGNGMYYLNINNRKCNLKIPFLKID